MLAILTALYYAIHEFSWLYYSNVQEQRGQELTEFPPQDVDRGPGGLGALILRARVAPDGSRQLPAQDHQGLRR